MPSVRHSVFWRVAGLLVGVQIVIAAVSVALAFWFAYDQSLDLAASSIRLRMDSAAEELEMRTDLREGLESLPLPARLDVLQRFEDGVFLLGSDGGPFRILADGSFDSEARGSGWPSGAILQEAEHAISGDSLAVAARKPLATASWALAPLYDADGFQAGGLLVYPLEESLAFELSGTITAYRRTISVVSLIALASALLFGLAFTWMLVRPLRAIAARIESVGAGDYGSRLQVKKPDEFGRLAGAVNLMAQQVETSIAALQSADLLRRQMVANMGHDLRTPLATLMGYVEEAIRLLGEGRGNDADEALDTAIRQGEHLQRLVDALFELSVLESFPPPIRDEPVPLGELLHEAASAHRPLFKAGRIRFEVDIAANLPVIMGDGMRLSRLLDNLLSNALRHTPEEGIVRLTASAGREEVVVRVSDSGHGISEEDRVGIFDRHVRGSGARTRLEEGTGLGLAISSAVAKAHGGRLELTSPPGHGACFELTLPVRKSESPGQTI